MFTIDVDALEVEALSTRVFTELVAFTVPVFTTFEEIILETRLSMVALREVNKFANNVELVAFVNDA
jgi:hypothetical protein